MTNPHRPQVFIEKIMPVKLLNEQVYYEHGGNPFKGLHRWYSRKPLSFSRASVLGSILPADISLEEFEYLLGLYTEEELKFWQNSTLSKEEREELRNKNQVKLYKTPPTEKQIQRVHELCESIWGNNGNRQDARPTILDQFAGGGSIPFEAVRYGLNVFASDLNPVAVITMKAAMEYPLKFGADLQKDIDKWVKWVGDEAEKRLADFFPSSSNSSVNNGDLGGYNSDNKTQEIPPSPPSKGGNIETVQNYLWAHTVICPNCQSLVPLSPNWWLYKRPEKQNLHKWCAVKPIPNLEEKRVDFELIKGEKGKGTNIIYHPNNNYNQTVEQASSLYNLEDSNRQDACITSLTELEYNPEIYNTISRGVGKCLCCGNVIEDDVIKFQAQNGGLGHQLYAVAYKKGKESLEFRIPNQSDLDGVAKAEKYLQENYLKPNNYLIPSEERVDGYADRCIAYGLLKNSDYFNPRQLLTLATYLEIINEAKSKLQIEYEQEKVEAICCYLSLVMDRCVDTNCRLSTWDSSRAGFKRASTQHALNLMWNYPETAGNGELWKLCNDAVSCDYVSLCSYFNPQNLSKNNNVEQASSLSLLNQLNRQEDNSTILEKNRQDACTTDINSTETKLIKINLESADSLYHIPDKSITAIITDPPYYGTIQYAELSDFFYVWMRRTLGDIFPDIFWQELTDKDREAVANPSRFRNMDTSPDILAKDDYEAKMALAWAESYRVLRDEGVLTVQFNHKESGAWDTLAKALIDAGFEITASWAVSTENPQNLHQAKKNSVSSTVILVCRKRGTGILPVTTAWWDDLRPEVANLVEKRAPEFEANDITGIDLYLSAFGPALNVFSRSYPILDNIGEEVRPEVAFAEARKAIANYRFRKLVQTDTAGFDALTQWYLLAWDAFKAREFPFDEARQLALAIGGFNVADLAKTHKLIDSKSGGCTLLTPQQRLKKRAFTTNHQEFSATYLIDWLHAVISIYEEEGNLQQVRQFMQKTGLIGNDRFMKTLEVAFKVIPDKAKEKESLVNLWLGIDEIKAKVVYEQTKLF